MEGTDEKVNQTAAEVVCPENIEPTVVGVDSTDCALSSAGKVRKPCRIIHCSDGIVEEYSDDDEYQVDAAKITEPPVDPSTLTWGPWFLHQTMAAGGSVLKACDYLGESLASLFGITSPKYSYEIEEYKRTMQQEEERKRKSDLENGGWQEPKNGGPVESLPMKEKVTVEEAAPEDEKKY